MRQRFRIIKVRRVKSPDHWGVQQFVGYTDGKPSYRLIEHLWSKADAVAFAALKNLGVDTNDVFPRPKATR